MVSSIENKYHFFTIHTREFVIVENICLVCQLDLTADIGVYTNAK